MEDEFDDKDDDKPPYRDRSEIGLNEFVKALGSLELMDDPYLRMQIYNLAIVDQFIMELEEDVLRKLLQEERTPSETTFRAWSSRAAFPPGRSDR
jgi:hypothetical protein